MTERTLTRTIESIHIQYTGVVVTDGKKALDTCTAVLYIDMPNNEELLLKRLTEYCNEYGLPKPFEIDSYEVVSRLYEISERDMVMWGTCIGEGRPKQGRTRKA